MESKFVRCPLCGEETLPGFIRSRDGLGRSEEKRSVAALSGTLADVKPGNTAAARNRPGCKAIYLEYRAG